jgi:hypothetical protein
MVSYLLVMLICTETCHWQRARIYPTEQQCARAASMHNDVVRFKCVELAAGYR